MKNLLSVIATIGIIYLLKKGTDSAKETGEELNFFDSLKRGFDLTMKSLSDKKEETTGATAAGPGFVTDKPADSEMVSFSSLKNSFPVYGSRLKKSRGTFHAKTIYHSN